MKDSGFVVRFDDKFKDVIGFITNFQLGAIEIGENVDAMVIDVEEATMRVDLTLVQNLIHYEGSSNQSQEKKRYRNN